MVEAATVKDFVKKNEEHLKKFMTYKTGITDKDILHDTIYSFYVSLIETRALDEYDPSKGKFDTYIITLFCWTFPLSKKKNHRVMYNHVSEIYNNYKYMDVWEFLGKGNDYGYKIEGSFDKSEGDMWGDHAHAYFSTKDECQAYLSDFISYIEKTEPPKKAKRMIEILKKRGAGCKSVDIAQTLRVSPNLVKILRQDMRKKFDDWKDGNT